jgi:PAS domain S-box-containing protein
MNFMNADRIEAKERATLALDAEAVTIPGKSYYSISTLLLALVAACILPLAAIFAYSTYWDTAQDFDRRQSALHALAKANAAEVGRLLANVRRLMDALAQRPMVRALDPERCDPLLETYRHLFPDIANIATIDSNGMIVCSAVDATDTEFGTRGNAHISVARTEWFRGAHRQEGLRVGEPAVGAVTGQPVSVITWPLPGGHAAASGLIAVSLNLATYDPNSLADALPSLTQTGIVRGDGTLVWRNASIDPAVRRSAPAELPLQELLAVSDGTTDALAGDQLRRIYGIAPVGEANLYAYVGIPVATVYAEDLRSAVLSVGLGFLTLLLASALGLVIARRITEPIFSLASTAQELRAGKTESRALVGGTAETASVAATFNRLVDDWQASERRFYESLRRTEDLYQNAPCGYHSINADGTFIRMNDTELRWLGYAREEVIGRLTIQDIMTPASRARFQGMLAKMLKTGTLRDLAANYVRKDGTLLPVLINASTVVDADGHFLMSRSTVYDMSERRQMERDREENARRVVSLSRQLVSLQEQERRQLSSELHDRTSANLAALGTDLTAITERMPQPLSDELADILADSHAVLDDTTRSLREICAELRPSILDYAGLMPALESYTHQFEKRNRVAVSLSGPDTQIRLSAEVESTLFRIVQEALTNCAKHAAGATRIAIELNVDAEHNCLTIADNGAGFNVNAVGAGTEAPGIGLLSMRQRAEFINGRFSIESRPGRGTTIRVDF